MKLAIVQLSDTHCKKTDDEYTMKIDQAITAISSLGSIDKAVLVFTGDLTDSSTQGEFSAAKRLIGRFVEGLSTKVNCGFIPIRMVPGNHDMILNENSRDAEEIESWKDKAEHLKDEFNLMQSFFGYAKSKKCFEKNCIYDVKTIKVGDVNIQFALLNSAPFSTLKPTDKQFHYFPAYVEEKMTRDVNADLKITVMHHHFEWCEWKSREILLRSLASDDITMFGHDHKAETLTTKSSSGNTYNIVMGGRFNLDVNESAAFNVIIYDSNTHVLDRIELNWDVGNKLFVPKKHGIIKKKNMRMAPNKEYLDSLLADKQNLGSGLDKYYVFPRIFAEGEHFKTEDNVEKINPEMIFSVLNDEKIIGITGSSSSGKSALLKYLYKEAIDRGYLPLFIEKNNGSKIEKLFKDMVELQYGESFHEYEKYEQFDHSKEIVFVDDIDLIKHEKSRDNLISYIIESGRLLIYSTKDITQNLEEVVKERLQGKKGGLLKISPFYKEKRDELVNKIGEIANKSTEEINAVITTLDYMVQCQADFFSLTPSDLIQYIKYFLRMGVGENKGIKTISIVFENNIRNSLLSCIHEGDIIVYLTLLEFIANCMYFELRTDKISPAIFEKIVDDYNTKRKGHVLAKLFLEKCIKAGILIEYSGEFNIGFINKNTFAYFVASQMNREIEKNPTNLEKLNYVMRNICFGINDIIIVFLSYVKNNTNMIINLTYEALALLEKYDEWDFDENNIPFMKYSCDMPTGLPQPKDKKHAKETAEKVEQSRQEVVKFKGIFDYNDEDANKEKYKILRALKYTQIIGRAMVDQYGVLEVDEIDKIINSLYVLPQKIISAMVHPYQENLDSIVKRIFMFAEKEMPEEKFTENDIKEMISQAGITLALNIMNDIAYNASSHNTVVAFRDYKCSTSNHKIMELMVEENVGNTSSFVEKAIDLRTEMEKNPYAQMLIAQIARKHITYAANIDHRQVNRLISGNVVSSKNRTKLLIEKGKKTKS